MLESLVGFLAACFLYWMVVIEPLCLWQTSRSVSVTIGNNSDIENSIGFLLKSQQFKYVGFFLAIFMHLDVTWSASIFFKSP